MDHVKAGAAPQTRRGAQPALLCLSHLRWDFVFQRPQHLMTRAARTRAVFFWEEPIWRDANDVAEGTPGLRLTLSAQGVTVVTPVMPHGTSAADAIAAQGTMLDRLVMAEELDRALLWYYTPAALDFSAHHAARNPVVYDCMDELSAFHGADLSLPGRERMLLDAADLVFTGGYSLYEVKRDLHPAVHPFPSGVDVGHFRPARRGLPDPRDQHNIPHPRLGFYGVIDERLDSGLIAAVAAARPDWHIVLVGPVVKVDPATLPCAANIHYLGPKSYSELPAYLGNWDVALMPFARNAATRFISPTKTPEYLAGGKPVVSTAITDVVRQYGGKTGVVIGDGPAAFVRCIETALDLACTPGRWLPAIEPALAQASWDGIWRRMDELVSQTTREMAGT